MFALSVWIVYNCLCKHIHWECISITGVRQISVELQ